MNPSNNSASWMLDKGSAMTFCPRKSGLLRVREGRVWVTFDTNSQSRTADFGDHFVYPGHDLPVRAGQRLVLESWPLVGASRISLVWEPLASKALARVPYRHNFFQAEPRCCK